ncbi:MAG: NADH-quinone oxidoreductase subunit L [Chitinophagaceae bacterium]|nr:NADH-quinone oxidoreductase subunit L [Oligoflexus sp.]
MNPTVASSLPFLILIVPLIGFFLNGVVIPLASGGITKTKPTISGGIATFAMAVSFVLAVQAFFQLSSNSTALEYTGFRWIDFGNLSISLNLRIDRLSSLMTMIITGIGTLIHFYSISYMSHEKGVARFFAYLNLFCFAMLLLVLSDNLLFLFFGWEGVGLCSYLLISYWYEEEANADAARKAFLVNRIGDLGFVLGMCVLYVQLGTLNFAEMMARISPTAAIGLLSLAGVLLFFASTGKSAQFPLYVWLPDAMAGPTPVSALIHAATMVTAGVYLFARMAFLFELSPELMTIVSYTGALTALLGGILALAQTDIKKVLAYSTVSQLGFMFLALGVGAYQTAVFHLMTHAFFKALLFLGAGSVIHGCDGEQDMRKMGGLAKSMPITFVTMLLGSAAIVGLPIFSGFFSKDEILYMALGAPRGNWILFGAGLVAAFLTGVYTIRMLTQTFWGPSKAGIHGHESAWIMTLPLVILAVLATFGGFLGIPHEIGTWFGVEHSHLLNAWLDPVVQQVNVAGESAPLPELAVSGIAVAVAIFGLIAGRTFLKNISFENSPLLSRLFVGQHFMDTFYASWVVAPLYWMSRHIIQTFESGFMGNIGGWIGVGSTWSGERLRLTQSGDIQLSMLSIVTGLAFVVGILIIWVAV